MDVREVFAALRAAWWLPVLGLMLGAGAALTLSMLQTPLYTSSTQLFVSTPGATSSSDAFQGGQFSQQRVVSYARLLSGEDLAARVIEELDLDTTPSELQEHVTATAVADSVLIDVSVTDPSPELAQRIAQTLGAEFAELVRELETPEGGASSPVKVEVTDRPNMPDAPSSPRPIRAGIVGALLGLLAGSGLALLRAHLDRSVRTAHDIDAATGSTLIGTILRDDELDRDHLASRASGNRTAEDFRQLRTNLQFLSVDAPPKTIMISSALPSEGKTTVVVNLALALADVGRKVVVVEADLRRPRVTRYLGMVAGAGLTNVLAGAATLEDVSQAYGESGNISVIGAGPTPPNPGELLASSHMRSVLDVLRERNDYVLVDAPPLLPVADASGLAVLMDGVVLTARYGTTTTEQLRQASVLLKRVNANVLGVILNIVPPKAELASAYGYGYGYGQDSGGVDGSADGRSR